MSNKTIRIKTAPLGSDKYVKLNINQEFDFIEVLSLKISQEEAYRNFCSDYGVVAGRVVINSGFGVPNARVSIFIPIDEVDKQNPQIKGLYPFEVISDKDSDGIRYNLLPKTSETENDCFTPVGTFSSKREILDDEDMMYVYQKYYKFTTSTNDAGDFMIFGVPLGNHKLHVDLDISDMGIASQRPYDSIEQGSSPSLFDSPTKFKTGTNLDRLAQIKTANTSVNVQPFWGDIDECQVGISRVDVDMNYNVTPSAIFTGSIFGDQDKYNVNNNCVADTSVGDLCLQMASDGTIEMVRKTVFGDVEKFDVMGGRVIDENGAWAYQVPMNLDYVVTDEYGQLVPSQDPTKGIPTRASVRFRIGMDNNMGGLGRHRTRAKYLIPNNPKTASEVDYEFGVLTKDTSFRDLYWNKIYTVKNFISRYQRGRSANGGQTVFGDVNNRRTLCLKNADGCIGDKNPLPFNRVSTKSNALFFIICLLMYFIAFILWIVNTLVISTINFLFFIWNSVLNLFIGICLNIDAKFVSVSWCPFQFLSAFLLDYIKCLAVTCPPKDEGESYKFAPGCYDSPFPINLGREALGGGVIFDEIPNLTKCIAVVMAKDMDLFKYDFYNDWLNGSLYSFLVRFKKYKSSETYCDFDCKDASCQQSIVMDTCFGDEKASQYVGLTEGIVKKNGDEYYYAATTKNAMYKIYATDILCLGAVHNCDWQGLPKIQSFLKGSSFNGYPIIDQFDQTNSANTLMLSGQVAIGPGTYGIFFNIDCDGLSSDSTHCKNIKHANEIGVDLDQLEQTTTQIISTPDHLISKRDINQIYGVYLRDMLYRLNESPNSIFLTSPSTINTNFNTVDSDGYDPVSATNNGQQYVDYRDVASYSSFQQPNNSYYFYFGLLPGKTGLDLMNKKFFTTCFPKIKTEFLVKILSFTGVSVSCQTGLVTNGGINFSILAGTGPFSVTTSGPSYNDTRVVSGETPVISLTNLVAGNYTVQVVDANNTVVNQTFVIPPPTPIYATANAINITAATETTGSISLNNIIGGCGPYSATLYDHSGALVQGPVQITTIPYTFSNLPQDVQSNGLVGNNEHFGYYIVLTDSSTPTQTYTIYDLTISGPVALTITSTTENVLCYGSKTGKVRIGVSGGTQPYLVTGIRTTPPPSVPNPMVGESFNAENYNTATAGDFAVTVKDQSNPSQEVTFNISIKHTHPELKIQAIPESIPKQCDPTKITVRFKITGTGTDKIPGAGKTYLELTQMLTGSQLVAESNLDYQNQVWFRYAFNNGIQPLNNPNATWSAPIPTTLLGGLTGDEFIVDIPITLGAGFVPNFSFLGIVLTTPNGVCISDYETQNTKFSALQFRLAPTLLIVNPNYTQQCIPKKVNIRFDISHLLAGIDYRAPYTLFYKIRTNAVPFLSTFTPYTVTVGLPPFSTTTIVPITENQQDNYISIPIPVGDTIPTSCDVQFYIVDSVGCQSQTVSQNGIQIPLEQLDIIKGTAGSGNVRYDATNGIPPYKTDTTAAGSVFIYNDIDFPTSVYPSSPIVDLVTVRDRNGLGCKLSETFIRNQ